MDAKAVGQKLHALRADRSVDEVACAVRISAFALHEYESGQRIPRDEVKLRLSAFYGTSIEALFFDTKEHETCTTKRS